MWTMSLLEFWHLHYIGPPPLIEEQWLCVWECSVCLVSVNIRRYPWSVWWTCLNWALGWQKGICYLVLLMVDLVVYPFYQRKDDIKVNNSYVRGTYWSFMHNIFMQQISSWLEIYINDSQWAPVFHLTKLPFPMKPWWLLSNHEWPVCYKSLHVIRVKAGRAHEDKWHKLPTTTMPAGISVSYQGCKWPYMINPPPQQPLLSWMPPI